MRIAVVYQYYQGRGSPGHSLVYELTQYLAERGHEVTVVSGEFAYMLSDRPTLPWYRRLLRREMHGKVQVVRTYTYSEGQRNYLGRLVSYLSFSVSGAIGLMTVPKPDVVLASSPPIFPMYAAWLVCRLRGIPYVMEVRDLWPASAIQLGILKSKPLIAIMTWMERVLYNRARRIIAITEGIRNDICERGWPADKVVLVTCGVDADALHPDAELAAAVRTREGWSGKKVALYFGALGEANNIPVILRAAKRLEAREDLLFVIIGDGMKRQAVQEMRERMGLRNVSVLPAVPKSEAGGYINAADVCLATLRDIPLFGGAIPTKLIDYMACGKPVVCGLRGEAKRLVEEAGAGYAFAPDDEHALAQCVTELVDQPDLARRLGERGAAYALDKFSARQMRRRTEEVLEGVVQPPQGPVGARQLT